MSGRAPRWYTGRPVTDRARRYATWIDTHRHGVLVLSVLIAVLGGMLAGRMPLRSDLGTLLPSSQPSVRDLRAIQDRARPFGTVQILVESGDAERTRRAGDALASRIEQLDAGLIAEFSRDDGPRHRYAWQHRFLFADYQDLIDARTALDERVRRAKLDANPLFISLDDEPADPDKDRLSDLEAKLADLEQQAKAPPARTSPDGRARVFYLQTTFSGSDTGRAHTLLSALERAIAEVRASVGGDVTFGLTGNVTVAMHEHDSVLGGMRLSLIITVVLCGIALVLYYRSGVLVLSMLWALAVGVTATFAVAWATIGYLNLMTAFLFAIVVGNGINASLILVARYLEELRRRDDPEHALAEGLRGAIPGTLGAAATAAIAYASLVITDFRGFRQFGAIGGIGMSLTWLATFTVLPALLCVLARRGAIRPTRPPAIGAWLARLLPRRLGRVLGFAAVLSAVALAIAITYIARDPFTNDWRDLQSSTKEIEQTHALNARIREALAGRTELAGQAYQLAIAVEDRAQVAPLVWYLEHADALYPPRWRWIGDVYSIDSLLPRRQPDKLLVLDEIRRRIDDPQLQATLDPDDKARLAKVRPPDDLRLVGDADIPPELAWPFIERDQSRGRLLILRGARRLDSFDVTDRLEFAAAARRLRIPAGAILASESLVVADIIQAMDRDAPRMILFALLGSVLAVLLVIGPRRHAAITLACGLLGVVVMIAGCAIAGLSVHFLDLIALPITVGIGIDYAINMAARDRQEGDRGPRHVLATTGGTVLLCSYTTMVGYGTLLLSANGGIRAFGLAALIGELACTLVALVVAPAWLATLRTSSRALVRGGTR